jgi:hypothetical protein
LSLIINSIHKQKAPTEMAEAFFVMLINYIDALLANSSLPHIGNVDALFP